MKPLLRVSLLSLFLVLPLGAANAFDQVVHYSVVYAVAIANGFSPADAALIANASYSLDDNDATTAFSGSLIAEEMKALPGRQGGLTELPHMRSGQVFHALTSAENRQAIEQAHLDRIQRALNDPREPGTPEQKRQRALVYLGEYMHFAADLVVHPTDPFLGHGPQGHVPDRGDIDPGSVRLAVAILGERMREFRDGKPIQHTQPSDFTRIPGSFGGTPESDHVLNDVVHAVSESWARTYPASGLSASALREAAGLNALSTDKLEKERTARAASEIARVLADNGLNYQVYHKITLDSDGEPIGVCARSTDSACDPAAAQSQFGSSRRIDVLPFATTLASSAGLRNERNEAVLRALHLAGAEKAVESTAQALHVGEETLDRIRKSAAWLPPSSPGGVALDPRLSIPIGEIGTPKKLTMDGDNLYLETASGRYLLDGISPRSFATVARTIAAGQIPYVTIGSEPSQRPGYAKVTYNPALMGTEEGAALYQADIQFKRIFAKLPFADDEIKSGMDTRLFASFPGTAGERLRFWITSSDISLAVDGARLVPRANGMRILSETTLRFNVRSDREMEAYAANLTRHWDDIAEHLWPFRAVERLARTTAMVFWARDHGVEIEPAILLLPPLAGVTPDYAPLVAVLDTDLAITGGVALTPEDKRTTIGRMFLSYLALIMSADRGTSVTAILALLFAIPSLLGGGLLFWLLLRAAARGSSQQIAYRRALLIWAALCGAQILLAAIISPLTWGETLSFFDRDMLALGSTLAAFPVLLFAAIRMTFGRDVFRARNGLRYAALALGLAGPFAASAAGVALACFTVLVTGPVPTPALNELLTAEIAISDASLRGLATAGIKPDGRQLIYPVPQSLLETFRPQYDSPAFMSASDASDRLFASGPPDPTMPWESLNRIRWPSSTKSSEVVHYSPDGEPPF